MAAGLYGVSGRAVQSPVEWVSSYDTGTVPTQFLPPTASLVKVTINILLCASIHHVSNAI
ncbi:hypothetical protein DPMN_184639 [Dreissena polymorpha]|uniref:Uncharacterized protein n=1 Tax=Dreissena polymorpha TaxID=45954 RepID=A0A9D4DIA7_DREPO|nr:hypothetical protein DPMN_184639 [Dreissena polymorpha]